MLQNLREKVNKWRKKKLYVNSSNSYKGKKCTLLKTGIFRPLLACCVPKLQSDDGGIQSYSLYLEIYTCKDLYFCYVLFMAVIQRQ